MDRIPQPSRVFALVFCLATAVFLLTGLFHTVLAGPAAPSFDCATASGIDTADCAALVALYDDTNGPSWHTDTNWIFSTTPCAADGSGWWGVTCDGARVTSILLQNNNLNGPLPGSLGNLTSLQILGLSDNNLNGTIPSALGDLAGLNGLYLARNSLEGAIPKSLDSLLQIQSFYLNGNKLSGRVPVELCALVTKADPHPAIVNFDLGYNALRVKNAPACFANAGFDWRPTQTVPPDITDIDTSVPGQVTLHWEPISYTESSHPGSTGGYEIFMASTSGAYQPVPERRTSARTETQATLLVDTGSNHYFKMRTYADPFPGVNNNLLESSFSREVSDDSVAVRLLAFDAAAAGPSWFLWGLLLVGLLFVPPLVAWLARRRTEAKE